MDKPCPTRTYIDVDPNKSEIKVQLAGIKSPALILDEGEMKMILDLLVENSYVIGHESDKPPHGLTYQYNCYKNNL